MTEKTLLSETHPHLEDFTIFLKHLNSESDRGRVLIAATMIDDLLLKSIQAYLIDGKATTRLTEGFNAPLGTLSSRIEAASAMGIINEEEYHDITIIRKIRNDFAHSITINFENPILKSRCCSLLSSAKSYGDVVVNAQGQFTTAATALILELINRPHYVSKKKLEKKQWPY